MTGPLIAIIAVAGFVFTVRLACRAIYAASRRDAETLYDDSEYRYRDAPHADDWIMGAMVALIWPITLPILLGKLAYRAHHGDPEQRWLTAKQRAVEQAREAEYERRRLSGIIAELERQYGPDRR